MPRAEPPEPPEPLAPVEVERPPLVVIAAPLEPPTPALALPLLDVDAGVVVAHWPLLASQACADGQTTFSHG